MAGVAGEAEADLGALPLEASSDAHRPELTVGRRTVPLLGDPSLKEDERK